MGTHRDSLDQRINQTLIIAMGVFALLFVYYALDFGVRGLSQDLSEQTHLFTADTPLPNTAIFTHMLAGALITFLAPLQLFHPTTATISRFTPRFGLPLLHVGYFHRDSRAKFYRGQSNHRRPSDGHSLRSLRALCVGLQRSDRPLRPRPRLRHSQRVGSANFRTRDGIMALQNAIRRLVCRYGRHRNR